MKVATLLENTACPGFAAAHGLSQYIEAEGRRILFDFGPDEQYRDNARRLGIDLSRVDIAFLSHGHSDHAGGLALFCRENSRAKVYAHPLIFGSYWAARPNGYAYIGTDPELEQYRERFVLLSEDGPAADGLTLFSQISDRDYPTRANRSLREKVGEDFPEDAFRHESNLLVRTESGRTALFCGCGHRGIVNILRRAEAILGRAPDYVLGGFHLTNPGLGIDEPEELVRAVGAELAARPETRYFTCHCTGAGPYDILKRQLGDRLAHLSSGTLLELP